MKFHTQYTSITDELENMCQNITSPTLSIRDSDKSRTVHEMSKAELAALIERQHLKECEENDYVMLSRLFYNRGSVEETDDTFEVIICLFKWVWFHTKTEFLLIFPGIIIGHT